MPASVACWSAVLGLRNAFHFAFLMTCQYLRLGQFCTKHQDSWLSWEIKIWQHCGLLTTWLEGTRATGRCGGGGSSSLSSAHQVCFTYLHTLPDPFWGLLFKSIRGVNCIFFPNRQMRQLSIIWSRGWETWAALAFIRLCAVVAFFIIDHCKDYMKITGVCELHVARGEDKFLILLKSSQCNWNFTWTK